VPNKWHNDDDISPHDRAAYYRVADDGAADRAPTDARLSATGQPSHTFAANQHCRRLVNSSC
jgi:hypothetical protein